MTNDEIRQIIRSSEDKLRFRLKLESLVTWVFTGFFLMSGSIAQYFIAWYAGLLICSAIVFGVWSLIQTMRLEENVKRFERTKTLHIWREVSKSSIFGAPVRGMALEVRNNIEEIYQTPIGENLLPLSQAIRLFDVCMQQQRGMKPIQSRLSQLYLLSQPLVMKTAQLSSLGEERAKSPQEERLDSEIEAAEKERNRWENSCNRMRKIVDKVKQEAQTRHLHRELDELSARLPRTHQSEPTFEAESLEDIERQIGREIETYLQLERETEQHLR